MLAQAAFRRNNYPSPVDQGDCIKSFTTEYCELNEGTEILLLSNTEKGVQSRHPSRWQLADRLYK